MAEESVVQSTNVIQGVVKWFSHKKGFGFLTDCSTNNDIFVHFSAIVTPDNVYKNLYEGEYVEFNIVTDDKGQLTAQNVRGIHGGNLLCQNPKKKIILVNKLGENDSQQFTKVKGRGRGKGKGKGRGGRNVGRGSGNIENTTEEVKNSNQYSVLDNE